MDTNYYINKSEKYRIIEKNGICKEYTLKENKLVFEGEFKNGKKMAKQKKLILLMVKFHLKEHIWMEKEIEREKNINMVI